MRRVDLEHIVRAASVVADVNELIIVGSQSILGAFPNAPPELLVSQEADLYPKAHPERAELIEGALGELSMFHETFGYYAQAVGPETCSLAPGWEDRLVKIQNEGTRGAIAWCLSPADLVVAKLSAQREKDFEFVRVMLSVGLVSCEDVNALLSQVQLTDEQATIAQGFLKQAVKRSANQ
jgi:hypothetical protein